MTRSEMLALMVGGMATIAGSVFAIHMSMLGGSDEEKSPYFWQIFVIASAMNAPAALLFAKILIPETGNVEQDFQVNRQEIGRNPIDALANGTSQGLQLALNVAAMLISFYAVILLINYFLSFIGSISVTDAGNLNEWISLVTEDRFEKLSLQAIFGFLLHQSLG